ncbi:MAG: ABC transporter ATP-binding protein, partial [Novosphingobium sp.]|nr:ABC transporter ATP-binding protein [Novosphingobium sp.]
TEPPPPPRAAQHKPNARYLAAPAHPDLYTTNPTRFAALTASIDKARAEKDAAEERWLELAEMVEG